MPRVVLLRKGKEEEWGRKKETKGRGSGRERRERRGERRATEGGVCVKK